MHQSPFFRMFLTGITLICLLLLVACNGSSSSEPFTYGVRVGNTDGSPIDGANVTVDVAGKPPLIEYTDSSGYAAIRIDADYAGQPGKLRVEADGYQRDTRNVTLYPDDLPQEIWLSLASADVPVPAPPETRPTTGNGHGTEQGEQGDHTPDAPTGWVNVTSRAGGFSVQMPAPPEEQVVEEDLILATTNRYKYTAVDGDSVYIVSYADYPADVLRLMPRQDLIDVEVSGMFGTLGMTNRETITVEGYQGVAASGKGDIAGIPQATAKGYFFFVDSRFFQLLVMSPAETYSSTHANAFLESFTLLDK